MKLKYCWQTGFLNINVRENRKMGTVEFLLSGSHRTGQVLDYHTLSVATNVLTGNILLLFLYFVCTTKQTISLFLLLLQGQQGPFVCFVASSQFTIKNAEVSEELLKLCVFSCQQYLVYSSLDILKSMQQLNRLNKVQITQDKTMESPHFSVCY